MKEIHLRYPILVNPRYLQGYLFLSFDENQAFYLILWLYLQYTKYNTVVTSYLQVGVLLFF